jgi:iron(III) transport system substrate-binding protein
MIETMRFAKTGRGTWEANLNMRHYARHRYTWHSGMLAMLAFVVTVAGCRPAAQGPEVVVYTALDSEFAQPILQDFSNLTQITALPKYGTESTKTVGLAEEILAEKARPRCDVFWNNDILHTLRLDREGLLDSYQPTQAKAFPPRYRSSSGAWHGFAARARVLLVNKEKLSEEERPKSIRDLTDPKWQGRVGLAKPLFGTTATHAACLFAAWGPEKAEEFFRQVKQNARILGGNKQVARQVATGQLVFGLTDTDDAMVEIENGQPVAIVYPDQEPDGLGTLFIPNTLAILKGCPHPREARELVDYLLTSTVENMLSRGPSAQIPLNRSAHDKARLPGIQGVHPMEVDFARAGEMWDMAARFLRDEFTGPAD